MTHPEQPPEPDEGREVALAARLAARGCALAAVAGAVWYLPVAQPALLLVQVPVTGLLLYLSFLALVVAAGGARGIVVRAFRLRQRRAVARAVSYGVLALHLLAAAAIFRLVGSLVAQA